jgi:hypothetical protein
VDSSNSPPIPRATRLAVGGFRFRRSFRMVIRKTVLYI